MKTLLQLKQAMQEIGAEVKQATEELRALSADSISPIEELRSKKEYVAQLNERFETIRNEVEREEAESRMKIAAKEAETNAAMLGGRTEEHRMMEAAGDFIRSVLTGNRLNEETRSLLGSIPTPHTSGGENLLPINVSSSLISEPMDRNPLRQLVPISNIVNLELPKIAFEISDDDFVVDGETAKEIELTGDKVKFQSHTMRIMARVADSVLQGSNSNIASYVRDALNSGIAAKEKNVMLYKGTQNATSYMSFYWAANGIKSISDETMFKAIRRAISDLHENYRANAKILMTHSDYYDMIEQLANGNATFYTLPPEKILGIPISFCDMATTPIVGDFSLCRLNYNGGFRYAVEPKPAEGEQRFIIAAGFDFRILLKSAFRLIKVQAAPGGTGGTRAAGKTETV